MNLYHTLTHPHSGLKLPITSPQAQNLLYQFQDTLRRGGSGLKEKESLLYQKRSEMKRRHVGEGVIGWGKWKPNTRGDRRRMLEECGPQCFLYPDAPTHPKFPICSQNTKGECFLDCKGVQAGYMRARQWRNRFPQYKPLADQAEVLKKNLCHSERTIERT